MLVMVPTSLILGVVYFWFPGLVIGRGVFLIAAVLVVVLVIAWRLCWEWPARTVGGTRPHPSASDSR